MLNSELDHPHICMSAFLSASDQSQETVFCAPLNNEWPTGFSPQLCAVPPCYAFSLNLYTRVCVCVLVRLFLGG